VADDDAFSASVRRAPSQNARGVGLGSAAAIPERKGMSMPPPGSRPRCRKVFLHPIFFSGEGLLGWVRAASVSLRPNSRPDGDEGWLVQTGHLGSGASTLYPISYDHTARPETAWQRVRIARARKCSSVFSHTDPIARHPERTRAIAVALGEFVDRWGRRRVSFTRCLDEYMIRSCWCRCGGFR
jgi:hypothetical protein